MSGTDGGFEVYREDVHKIGTNIRDEISKQYWGILPDDNRFERPDGGDPAFNGVLDTALQMIGQMHRVTADAIWVHGQKIVDVTERYEAADEDNERDVRNLLNQIVNTPYHRTA